MGKHSLLIVDDEAILRESLRDWLVDAGYEISLAMSGEEALQMLKDHHFSFLVIDYGLPGINGILVLKKANEIQPRAKSVIMTANPSLELAKQAVKLGAVDCLSKPFAPDILENLINKSLSKNSYQAA